MQSRLNFLDGLRGVAILLVIAFHAYSRWPHFVPYGDAYQNFPLFKLGWVGVELFFLISGFVIFMTLDKTINFRLFIYKRWLRLFPVMLLATILIYFTAPMLTGRPAGSPDFLSLIPGLTFIETSWWSNILGVDIKPLERAFWSIYVECKFYVIAGLIYFFLGRKYLAPCLFILFVGSLSISYIAGKTDSQIIDFTQLVFSEMSFRFFGWFCSGTIFYLYYQTKREHYFLMAVVVAVLSSIFIGGTSAPIAALMISALFAASLRVSIIQQLLTHRVFMFFGLISYPLYLIHENSMISMVMKLPDYLPWLNMFFYPFIPVAFLSLVSFLIATKYEIKLRGFIEALSFSSLNRLFGKGTNERH